MAHEIKTNLITYQDPDRHIVSAKGFTGPISDSGTWESMPGYEGLRYMTFCFEGIDASIKDGAKIELPPGIRSPLQLNKSDKTYYETFIKGRLLFLMVSPDGELFVDSFDSSKQKDSYTLEVPKGYMMCWLSSHNQPNPAEVLEYEEPGYNPDDLFEVSKGTLSVNGQSVPPKLWEIIQQFESGVDPVEFNNLTEFAHVG